MVSDAALSGVEHSLISSGVDVRKGIGRVSNEEIIEEIDFAVRPETKGKKSVSVLTKAEAVSEAIHSKEKQAPISSDAAEVITAPAIVSIEVAEKEASVAKAPAKAAATAKKVDEKKPKIVDKNIVEEKTPTAKKTAEKPATKAEKKPVVVAKKKKAV
jgi:hypothetical protein